MAGHLPDGNTRTDGWLAGLAGLAGWLGWLGGWVGGWLGASARVAACAAALVAPHGRPIGLNRCGGVLRRKSVANARGAVPSVRQKDRFVPVNRDVKAEPALKPVPMPCTQAQVDKHPPEHHKDGDVRPQTL